MKKLSDLFPFYKPSGPIEYMVVGLGNPGKQYEHTRHNAGFMAVDRMAQKLNFSVERLKFKSLCGDALVAGHRALFLKPSTFMNKSGEAVVEAMEFYKIPPQRVIVLFDDISLDVGRMRIRRRGSDGGHNGMKNIIYLSGSDDFPRIKIGIGAKPHPDYNLADWVLSVIPEQQLKLMDPVLNHCVDAVERIITGQIDQAMNLYNKA